MHWLNNARAELFGGENHFIHSGSKTYNHLGVCVWLSNCQRENIESVAKDVALKVLVCSPCFVVSVCWASCGCFSPLAEAILLEVAQKQAALSFCSTEVALARAEAWSGSEQVLDVGFCSNKFPVSICVNINPCGGFASCHGLS